MNNLLAAPGFSSWLEGQPLDIQSILYTPAGKPRMAIFSIAHLGDAERMFFVSLLLNQVLGWTRQQSGTTSLRVGTFLGRKVASAGNIGRATTAARGASRTYKESQDVARAGETVQALQQQLADLQSHFETESAEIASATDPQTEDFETIALKPRKTNITVRNVLLAWVPHWRTSAGESAGF